MSSQSHLPHCRVLPPGEFNVMIPEPHATLQGAVTDEINVVIVPHCRVWEFHPAYWKSFSPYFISVLFSTRFRLWRAAAFVSSPIHLTIGHRHVFLVFHHTYLLQLLNLGKLSRPKCHAFSLKLLIFWMLQYLDINCKTVTILFLLIIQLTVYNRTITRFIADDGVYRRVRQEMRLASDSSWARHHLKHLSWGSRWIILYTLEQRIAVSCEISRADRCLIGTGMDRNETISISAWPTSANYAIGYYWTIGN